tara:strand:+ start:1648 stop:2805 length:1158 start_codon:yes stop_codon:yes gene_type:complete
MSQNYLYHTLTPENQPSSGAFTEFAMADFVLNFPQRKLVAGSIRISANVECTDSKADSQKGTSNIYVDNLVGSHAFFDQISTSMDQLGQIENILEYSKYVKAVSQATTSPTDLFKGSKVSELISPNLNWSKAVIKGISSSRTADATTLVPAITEKANFSMKPLICLNSAAGGDGTVSFRKSGSVRISMRVARALSALFGPGVSASGSATAPSVKLTNLRLHFSTVNDDGQDMPITMPNIINIKSTVQSTFANISCAVPAICRGVFGTLLRVDRANVGENNNPLATETIPGFKSLQFIYNSTINNSLVSYTINDYAEVLERYVASVSSSDHSSVGMWNVAHNDGFGVGLEFDGLVDLRSQRFNIQISSTINSPYTLSLFFNGVQTI